MIVDGWMDEWMNEWAKYSLERGGERKHLGTKRCELAELLLSCRQGRYSAGAVLGVLLLTSPLIVQVYSDWLMPVLY